MRSGNSSPDGGDPCDITAEPKISDDLLLVIGKTIGDDAIFRREMKNVKMSLAALAIGAMSLFAFRNADTGIIKGTVTPPEAATKIWVMSKTDTVSADISQGKFEVKDLKAGTYNIVVEAKAPYKSIGKEGITIADSQVDVGEIKLAK